MRYTEDQIERARASDLLALIGSIVELRKTSTTHGGEYHGPCPFCGGKDRFCVWPLENPPYWWCRSVSGGRGCGKKGNAIDFAMEYYNASFQDAVGMLLGEHPAPAFKPPPRVSPLTPAELEPVKVTPAMAAALGFASRVYHLALLMPAGKPGREYLQKRGIDVKTIKKFRIGYVDPGVLLSSVAGVPGRNGPTPADEVLRQLEEASLIGRNEEDGSRYEKLGRRVVFPNILSRGQVVQMMGRSLKASEPPMRWLALAKLKKELYPIGMCRSELLTFLTESVIDTINLWQLGVQALSPWGTKIKEEMLTRLMGIPHLVILPQKDPEGEEWGQLAAAEWARRLPHAKVVTLPYEEGQKDFNDIWREAGAARAGEILRAACAAHKIEWQVDAGG